MAIIGVDIGGTNLRAVSVTAGGEIAGKAMVGAGGKLPRKELFRAIRGVVNDVCDGDPPTGIGFSVGGAIQLDGTMQIGATNLPNLADTPLAPAFEKLLGKPCRVDHDGRSTMRGEAWIGAAKGLRQAMSITFGTGIGAGLLLDGKIFTGAHGSAGEIGVWRPNSPQRGGTWPNLEELVAPANVAKHYEDRFDVLLQRAETDKNAAESLSQIFELIGRSVANAHLLLDLEAVVLTGGVTAIGEPFRLGIEKAYLNACPAEFRHDLSIRLGELGAFAGAVGAAALWRHRELTEHHPNGERLSGVIRTT